VRFGRSLCVHSRRSPHVHTAHAMRILAPTGRSQPAKSEPPRGWIAPTIARRPLDRRATSSLPGIVACERTVSKSSR
jgi:hypothetical protein